MNIDTLERGHVIDLDADPFVPKDWMVEEHQKGGNFRWDASRVIPLISKKNESGGWLQGNTLRKELKEKPVFNANLLDYLLMHPSLIPADWKDKYIFFWGTIYRQPDGGMGVRCIYWHRDRWLWRGGWLIHQWHGSIATAQYAT